MYECWVEASQFGVHLPAWMFDASRCATMRLSTEPWVCWQALAELRSLLDAAVAPPAATSVQNGCREGDADERKATQDGTAEGTDESVPCTEQHGTVAGAVGGQPPGDPADAGRVEGEEVKQ